MPPLRVRFISICSCYIRRANCQRSTTRANFRWRQSNDAMQRSAYAGSATRWRGAWALPLAGSSLLAFDMHPIDWPYSESTSPSVTTHVLNRSTYAPNPSSVGKTQRPNVQGPNKDTVLDCARFSDQALAAAMPCNPQTFILGVNGYMSAAPRSMHSGGVNVSYLDGHVTFLGDDVDDVVMALAVSVTDE